jgi:hypothetical protein
MFGNKVRDELLHLRFEGRSFDISLLDLDVGVMSSDREIKNALAKYLGIGPSKLQLYLVDRHKNGNLTVRPEAVFG